jgi:uncharacterized Tic20 family protein
MDENVQQPTPETPPQAAQPAVASKDANTWGMLCHLIAFAGFILPVIGNIVGPLVIWLIKKDEFEFVDDQGKESLNFQISMTIYFIISGILTIIIIGALLLIALSIFDIVMIIIATIKANGGEKYRYPLTIRFIK